MSDTEREVAVKALVHVAKALAAQYYLVTGKPLGVTGEVAEVEAAEKLGLSLAVARTAYFDAYRETAGQVERFQIKGRAVDPQDRYRGRTPAIKCDGDYDQVLLVLLDRTTYDVLEILQASRTEVARRLDEPGSRSRNERKSMGISQFKSIADRVWPAEPPPKVVAWPDDGNRSADQARAVRSVPRHGGPIGGLIAELLLRPELDYAQIVWRVKQAFPEAKTSTKSVASTARDLRRNGIALPARGSAAA
jgi:hypothetical protein